MSAKKTQPTARRIFDAAASYLQDRRLIKDGYGKNVCERKFNARDMYHCFEQVDGTGAVGALYAGAGIIRAGYHEVDSCVEVLNKLVTQRTRGKCNYIGDYTDRSWVQKRHVLQLLRAARDQ